MTTMNLSTKWLAEANREFVRYSNCLIANLRRLASSGDISFWTLSIICAMIDESLDWSSANPEMHDLTYRYYHSWNYQEYKILSISDGFILSNDERYWLRRYPGLNIQRRFHKNENVHRVCHAQAPLILMDDFNNCSTISHNGHFGHFLGDDLSRWIIFNCLGAEIVPSLVGYRPNLHMTLAELDLTPLAYTSDLQSKANESENLSTESTRLIKTCNARDIRMAPRVHTVFLAAYFLREWAAVCCNSSIKPGLLFLRRAGSYRTRIANISEFESYLLQVGFDIVDPSTLSMSELTTEISGRKLIISESGTTTLLANLFGSLDTVNVILLPDALRNAPDIGMLLSGLPYMFSGYGMKQPFYGTTVATDAIQTSFTVRYEINDLSLLLTSLLDN